MRARDRAVEAVAEGRLKVLFIARHFAYFRNYESAIESLARRGHQVHLAAERDEELGGREMVDRLAAAFPGAITTGWVPEREDVWSAFATSLRLTIDYLRYLDRAYDSTPKLRARARERVPRLGLSLVAAAGARTAFGRRLLGGVLRACERAIPASAAVDAFIREQRPDVVLLTPLIGVVASPQLDCLQSAKSMGRPTALCVWSWDHLSSKAIVRNVPDRVFVWNETQRTEATTLHGVPDERVVVTGAQCFDHWFDRRPSTDRAAFCRAVGLPDDRPFLLYVCSSLFRGTVSEARFVQRWIAELRASGQEPLASTPILVRPHPARMKQWADVDLSADPGVVIWGQSPVTPAAKNGYFDSLHHSAAVVGLNTSAFLEAAIAGRAVHAPLLPEHYENQEGTIHFHYLMHVGGGLLHTARTLPEHFEQVNAQLQSGQPDSARSRRFVEAFIRPRGMDTAATPAFVDGVEAMSALRVEPARASVGVRVLRTALRPLAGLARRGHQQGILASERDRLVIAERREARHREDMKQVRERQKKASVETRRREKAQRLAEWHRAKASSK